MALETSSCAVVFEAGAAPAVVRKDAPPLNEALVTTAVPPTGLPRESFCERSTGGTPSECERIARHDEMARAPANAININAKGRNR
jgi:hypothetical protein